jgi:hypothetical protein
MDRGAYQVTRKQREHHGINTTASDLLERSQYALSLISAALGYAQRGDILRVCPELKTRDSQLMNRPLGDEHDCARRTSSTTALGEKPVAHISPASVTQLKKCLPDELA